jgi:hypothetical protein
VAERKGAYRVMAPELEGKKPPRRSRGRWQKILKCILQQLDGAGEGALTELICLRIGAGVNTVMNFRVV